MNAYGFIKKYLPDYDEKIKIAYFMESGYLDKLTTHEQNIVSRKRLEWINENFLEALQNFTDKICEEQRKNCNDKLKSNCDCYSKKYIGVVLEAKQPKIE